MPFTRLHYHLMWTTLAREPRLTGELEEYLHRAIAVESDELHAHLHALGNAQDHVHVVVALTPRLAVADCVKRLKRASAQAVNRHLGTDGNIVWQSGYGAVTLDGRSLNDAIAYVQNHPEHHRQNMLFALFEQTSDDVST